MPTRIVIASGNTQKAEEIQALLGDDFDVAGFHAALLEGGPIPMGELDARVDRWLQGQRRASRRP